MAWRRCRGAACALMGPVDRPAALNQGVDGANDRLDAHPARNCRRSVVAGPCRAPGTRRANSRTSGPWARTPTPFGRRLVCHAPPRTQEGHPPRHPSKHKRFAVRSRSCVSQTSNGRRAAKVSPTRRDLQHAFALPCSIGVRLLALAAFTTGFIRQLEMGPRAICSVCAFAAATRGANHARAGLTYNGYGRGIARSGRAPPERWLLLQ